MPGRLRARTNGAHVSARRGCTGCIGMREVWKRGHERGAGAGGSGALARQEWGRAGAASSVNNRPRMWRRQSRRHAQEPLICGWEVGSGGGQVVCVCKGDGHRRSYVSAPIVGQINISHHHQGRRGTLRPLREDRLDEVVGRRGEARGVDHEALRQVLRPVLPRGCCRGEGG